MPHHLLTIPSEIRMQILQHAVTLEPIMVCESSRDHILIGPRPRGFKGNPTLPLHLVCSQITDELKTINIPRLDLKMCEPICIGRYVQAWPLMKERINSFEVRFFLATRKESGLGWWKKQLLLWSGETWTSRVEIINSEVKQSVGLSDLVTGNAIYIR